MCSCNSDSECGSAGFFCAAGHCLATPDNQQCVSLNRCTELDPNTQRAYCPDINTYAY
jgi:hypothetical protein